MLLKFKTILCLTCLSIFFNCIVTQINSYSKTISKQEYNPTICTIMNYYFTFIYDGDAGRYKIHGLWPNQCNECISCGYPTCCNYNRLTYEYPEEFDTFIKSCWYSSYADGTCNSSDKVILFEHEFYKYRSCLNVSSTTDCVALVESIYSSLYQQYVYNERNNTEQLWLELDNDLSYVQMKCFDT